MAYKYCFYLQIRTFVNKFFSKFVTLFKGKRMSKIIDINF